MLFQIRNRYDSLKRICIDEGKNLNVEGLYEHMTLCVGGKSGWGWWWVGKWASDGAVRERIKCVGEN